MSKKVFFLIILLLIQLGILPSIASAISCQDSGIKVEPSPLVFIPGSTNFEMTFTISNTNALNNLKGASVYLLIDKQIYSSGYFSDPPAIITDSTFKITLPEGGARSVANHEAVLRWAPAETNDWGELCSGISYQVGSVGACTILQQSVPDRIPLNSQLTIKFIGKPDTNYQLRAGTINAASQSTLDNKRTNNNGQGEFSSKTIPGSNGDRIRITVVSLGTGAQSCYRDTTIDLNAPPPAAVPDGPVAPIPKQPGATPCTDLKNCSSGGGKDTPGCTDATKPDPTNPNKTIPNPGIATAIGCIHTSPAEFTKDLLKFIIGIGGGLAFLMMLLGAYQMLSSGGNPEGLKAGQDRLTSAVIGLLFIIFSILLLQIIGVGILNIPGFGM